MRISLFDQWGALNSAPVWSALQQGFQRLGIDCVSHDRAADAAVIWSVVWAGRMKQNRQIWQEFRTSGRPVIVAEVGMIDRGHTWKLGVNGIGAGCYNLQDLDSARPQRLKMRLSDWQNTGRNIVIALQRHDSQQWDDMPDIKTWLDQTISQLRLHTDRPIVVRPHPRQRMPQGDYVVDVPTKVANTYDSFNFDQGLQTAWAVVNWNSGTGCRSVLNGVPAFVGGSSLAAPVANLDWSQIENPLTPDRSQWIVELSHTEWTVSEIAEGHPLQRLLELQAF